MINRQIEKLQKMVNNLLGVIAKRETDTVLDDCALNPEMNKQERLGVMLLKAQDGVLEDRYFLRMEKWLLCDESALRYYVDFQSLTAMLSMHFNPDRYRRNLVNKQIFASQ